MAKLSDFCKINMGQSPDSSSYNENGKGMPFFQGNADFGELNPEVRVWCDSPTKIANPNDILISVRAPIGALNIATVQCCIGRGLAALTADDSKCTQKFLWYALQSKVDELNSKGTGSTFKAISKSVLFDTEIPLPNIESQNEIVAIMDRVTELIKARRAQLKELEQLVKSRFIELFGDPELNLHGWRKTSIGDVISSCEAGWSANGTQREKKPGEIAVLKVSAVTKGFFIPEECKVLDNQSEIKKFVFPQRGDLLFSRANTREMVGATAVILQDYPELILPDKLWKIRFVSWAHVLYMKHILSHHSIRSKFSAASTGTSGSMFNVSMDKFKSTVIPLPPIELQNEFAAFVEQTDKLKFDNGVFDPCYNAL